MLNAKETRISSSHLGLWLVCSFFNGEGKTLIVCGFKIDITPSTFLFHLAPPRFFHFSCPVFFLFAIFLSSRKKLLFQRRYSWLVEQDNSDLLLYYIHFEITSDPCNLIGSQQCDLFRNHTIFCSKSHGF